MPTTTPLTIFSWGYHGWGNHTPQFVRAADAVEASRGFAPPLFVDIRIRRSVRAKGFQGAAFEKLLGPSRHRWMKSLGNRFILTRKGRRIQIAEPAAAEELLDLALASIRNKRRLIFFCSCPWPRHNGKVACHRATVAGLVLAAAEERGTPVEVVEWPGGEPTRIELGVKSQLFSSVRKGRMAVPLGKRPDLAEVAGLPWCSVVTLGAGNEELHRVVGPAIRQGRQWALPVLCCIFDPATPLAAYEEEAEKLRRGWGLESASG